MCIRDSANRKNWLEDPAHWREKTRDIEDRLSDALHERLTPVSYTHLRAHETVLDLVCRLLLEKKKTNRELTIKQ